MHYRVVITTTKAKALYYQKSLSDVNYIIGIWSTPTEETGELIRVSISRRKGDMHDTITGPKKN